MPAIVLLGVHVLTPQGCILASLTRLTCIGGGGGGGGGGGKRVQNDGI
jgi:hypothetical protein